jgi:hypothetical protein
VIGPGVANLEGLNERSLETDWLLHDHDGRIEASPENITAAAAFVFDRWRERAAELGHDDPRDLSGACKFCALFAKALFGGTVDGDFDHVFVRVDGAIIDLSAASADVGTLDDPYGSDVEHLVNEDLTYSFGTCARRVRAWMATYPMPAHPLPAP